MPRLLAHTTVSFVARAEKPFRRKLVTYARNMAGRAPLTEKYLDFALALLSDKCKGVLRSLITPGGDGSGAQVDSGLAADILKAICASGCGPSRRQIESELRDLLGKEISSIRAPEWPPGLVAVQRLFRLEDEDIELLAAMVGYHQNWELERFLDDFNGASKVSMLSLMTGVPVTRIMSRGGARGRLARCGLIECESVSERNQFSSVNADIMECVLGINDQPLVHKFCRRFDDCDFTLDRFDMPEHSLNILQALIAAPRPSNILLYGEPGTGKTEFSKSIAMACRKTACFVQSGEDGNVSDRRMTLLAAANSVSPADAVVVVDEADNMLNSRYAVQSTARGETLAKAWLNEFLDSCPASIIWITNDVSGIEHSTRRRFTFAFEFKRHSIRRRRALWAAHLKRHPLRRLLPAKQIDSLAREYQVNAAVIGQSLEALGRVIPPQTATPEAVMGALRELLDGHLRLSGQAPGPGKSAVPVKYDPDAVCSSVEPGELLAGLRSHAALKENDRPPVNLLFWGEPGTGKTALARYLAQAIDKVLLVKRASDLLSMWVGGTEKAIRAAFEEARDEEAVLLLDEADSFFIDRRTALRSWETSQTNELLTQMESHPVISICCTNLLHNLDAAAMRRFAWKVCFKPLGDEARVRLFGKYFPEAANSLLRREYRIRLERIPGLTPGDLSAVRRRFALRPGRSPKAEIILDVLADEVSYRGRGAAAIGFGAAGSD